VSVRENDCEDESMTQPDATIPNTSLPTPAPGRRRLRLLLAVCSWAYLAAVLALWLVLGQAETWWPATMLLFAPRWVFALPLAVLVPAALLARSRMIGVVAAAALVVAGPVSGFNVPWPRLTSLAPTGKPFRVLTLNMHYSKADPAPFEELIAAVEPDVVAVQEWPASRKSSLKTAPGWYVNENPRLVLASRYPIRAVADLGLESMSEQASVTRYELDTPVGPVHIFNLHLASNRQGISDTIHENRDGPALVQANSDLRREQSEFVVAQAAGCPGPVLVVGDFNTPPESRIFARVWDGYTDAFSAAGWGYGYTFIGAKTMVRIDHVLANRGWLCTGCRVGPSVGSPHRPVIADLVWTGTAHPERE
jgi:vancomycin resistance protein VanJ